MSEALPHPQIKALTALRGYAAVWVILSHYFAAYASRSFVQYIHFFKTPWVSAIINRGHLGVDIFFMLSGFIIAHIYLPFFQTHGVSLRSFTAFIMRRVARIYPLHLVTLLALGLLSFFGFGQIDALSQTGLIHSLLLIQGWGWYPVWNWNAPAWSISVEWQIYLLFPFLIWLLSPGRHWGFSLLKIALLILILQWFKDSHREITSYTIDHGIFRGLPLFGIGFCLHALYRQSFLKSLPWNSISIVALLSIGIGIECGLTDTSLIEIMVIYLYSLAFLSGRANRAFSNKAAMFLGDISYSVYLWHVPFFLLSLPFYAAFSRMLPCEAGGQACLITSVIAFMGLLLLLSYLSYRYIEKPSRNFINRLQQNVAPL